MESLSKLLFGWCRCCCSCICCWYWLDFSGCFRWWVHKLAIHNNWRYNIQYIFDLSRLIEPIAQFNHIHYFRMNFFWPFGGSGLFAKVQIQNHMYLFHTELFIMALRLKLGKSSKKIILCQFWPLFRNFCRFCNVLVVVNCQKPKVFRLQI